MNPAFIIYERSPRYAPALSRLTRLPRQEVRSLAQARAAVSAAPHSMVALEVSDDGFCQVAELAWWAKRHGAMALIAISPRQLKSWDSWLITSGVNLIFRSHLDLPLAKRLFRRHQEQLARLAATEITLPFREQVWQQLPWKRYDSGGRS